MFRKAVNFVRFVLKIYEILGKGEKQRITKNYTTFFNLLSFIQRKKRQWQVKKDWGSLKHMNVKCKLFLKTW